MLPVILICTIGGHRAFRASVRATVERPRGEQNVARQLTGEEIATLAVYYASFAGATSR